jgi:hypothetical protein
MIVDSLQQKLTVHIHISIIDMLPHASDIFSLFTFKDKVVFIAVTHFTHQQFSYMQWKFTTGQNSDYKIKTILQLILSHTFMAINGCII